ncbi:MAG: histidine phosphatase family protein [Ectothiorhodospiraceae bacterium]|nr:histidine phosphatase family protein [Ectothiorhodospiraceae bacterium]
MRTKAASVGNVSHTASVLCVLGLVLLTLSWATARADTQAWAALARPGHVALMRHALAPGFGDPPEFTLGDCATQRNLSAEGREQARRIGAALRDRGVVLDAVYSSEWCRCLETAEQLGMGPVEPLPSLNSFFSDRAQEQPRTAATLDFLRRRADRGPMMLVTHQVNISALTGAGTNSGEIVVAAIEQDRLRLVGRITVVPD